MKKYQSVVCTSILVLTLAGCGQSVVYEEFPEDVEQAEVAEQEDMQQDDVQQDGEDMAISDPRDNEELNALCDEWQEDEDGAYRCTAISEEGLQLIADSENNEGNGEQQVQHSSTGSFLAPFLMGYFFNGMMYDSRNSMQASNNYKENNLKTGTSHGTARAGNKATNSAPKSDGVNKSSNSYSTGKRGFNSGGAARGGSGAS